MPLLTVYDPERLAAVRGKTPSELSPFTLAEETTTMPDFPASSHPLTTPITNFRGMDPIWGWKCWATQTQLFDHFNNNLAAIPQTPGIIGWLFFHNYNGYIYRTQWYGEDTYTMWDATVKNGRAIAAAAYEQWRSRTIFDDMVFP